MRCPYCHQDVNLAQDWARHSLECEEKQRLLYGKHEPAEEVDAPASIENMTIAELKEFAESWEIDLEGATLKADILDRIVTALEG